MACTIVTTPALGASDWSGWITQQGLTDRGFMRLSLTHFSGTAASTVAAGSILECAGSIYSFTDTAITLAAATASAAVAVYFVAIPSAGGTTCTIQMDSTAPTWIDAKQGFYASAASVSRVFGGCYIGTAATYHTKFIYADDALNYCLAHNKTRPLVTDFVSIGEWNMDATTAMTIVTRVVGSRIRHAVAFVKKDTGAVHRLEAYSDAGSAATGTVYWLDQSNPDITINRVTGGYYDANPFYDGTASTVPTRGWVTYTYEA